MDLQHFTYSLIILTLHFQITISQWVKLAAAAFWILKFENKTLFYCDVTAGGCMQGAWCASSDLFNLTFDGRHDQQSDGKKLEKVRCCVICYF